MISFADLDQTWRIERIEQAPMVGERPRLAGCNARLGVHGKEVRFPLVRITIGGIAGYGWSPISRTAAEAFIGTPVADIFSEERWVKERFEAIQFPLLDWLGAVRGVPVYQLLTGRSEPLEVPAYDTSLYFDDLHLKSQKDAVKLMQEEDQKKAQSGPKLDNPSSQKK